MLLAACSHVLQDLRPSCRSCPLPGRSGSFFHLIFLTNCHQWHCSRVSCREVKESSKHTDAAREAQDMRRSVGMCVHIESTSLKAESVSSMPMLLLSSVCCCLLWACFITICSERIGYSISTQLSQKLNMSLIDSDPNGLCAVNGLLWTLLTSFLLQVSAGTHDSDLARHHISRRDALLAGISSVAAAQALSPAHAPAAQSANLDPVTPVNITPKETVELGQSGAAKGSEPIKDGTPRDSCLWHLTRQLHAQA